MLPEWLPWLLQVSDSQFPSGSYAHSQGLEELVACGAIADPDGLRRYLLEMVIPGLCAFELPTLARAHRAAVAGDSAELAVIDHELEAWKMPAELRMASRQMGSRRLSLVQQLYPSDFLEEYVRLRSPQHQLIVCAAELRAAPVEAVACAFAVQTLSGNCAASMKLLRMGQERSQRLLRESIQTIIPRLASAVAPGDSSRTGWFNPALEIASMRHARARERLFIS